MSIRSSFAVEINLISSAVDENIPIFGMSMQDVYAASMCQDDRMRP